MRAGLGVAAVALTAAVVLALVAAPTAAPARAVEAPEPVQLAGSWLLVKPSAADPWGGLLECVTWTTVTAGRGERFACQLEAEHPGKLTEHAAGSHELMSMARAARCRPGPGGLVLERFAVLPGGRAGYQAIDCRDGAPRDGGLP